MTPIELWLCPCDGSCRGDTHPIHDSSRALTNAQYVQSMGQLPPRNPFDKRLAQSKAVLTRPAREMKRVIDNVLQHMAEFHFVQPTLSTRYDTAIAALNSVSEQLESGLTTVPAEVAQMTDLGLKDAAAYTWVADMLLQSQGNLQASSPSIGPIITELLELAQRMRVGFAQSLPAQVGDNGSAESLPSIDTANAIKGESPHRPGLGVFQRCQGTIHSMGEVNTQSNVVTIGSGIETVDTVDTFDLRALCIKGLDILEIMHPLQQADLAMHKTMLLLQLKQTFERRREADRDGRRDGVHSEAVQESEMAITEELWARGIPASLSDSNTARAKSTSKPPEQPVSGSNPFEPLSRRQTYDGNPGCSTLGSMMCRNPYSPIDLSADPFAKIEQLGSGQLSSEYAWMLNGREIAFQLPLADGDIGESFDEESIIWLKARLEKKNFDLSIDEVREPLCARRYKGRAESIPVLDAWLKTNQKAKASAAADAAATVVTQEGHQHLTPRLLQKTSEYEKRELDSEYEASKRTAHDVLAFGVADREMRNDLTTRPPEKPQTSAATAPDASGSAAPKEQRSASLHGSAITQDQVNKPEPSRRRHGMSSRTASQREAWIRSYGRKAPSSRTHSYHLPTSPQHTSGSDHIVAFPNAQRSPLVEAQFQAMRNHLAELGTEVKQNELAFNGNTFYGDMAEKVDHLRASAEAFERNVSTTGSAGNPTVAKTDAARDAENDGRHVITRDTRVEYEDPSFLLRSERRVAARAEADRIYFGPRESHGSVEALTGEEESIDYSSEDDEVHPNLPQVILPRTSYSRPAYEHRRW